MMVHPAKRPFADEVMKTRTFIDLTDDNDDIERPFKRQRSGSYSAPKIPPYTVNPGTRTTNEPGVDGISSKLSNSSLSNKHLARNEKISGTLTRSLHEASNTAVSASGTASSKHNGRYNGLQSKNGKYVAAIETSNFKKSLTEGEHGLSLRQSPRPLQNPARSTAPSLKTFKSSRSPEVIDLDTDSDRASKKLKPTGITNGSTSSHSIPPKAEKSKLSATALSGPQPIRHDSINKQLHTNSSFQRFAAPNVEAQSSDQPSRLVSRVESDAPRKPIVRVNLPPTASQQYEIIRKLKEDVNYMNRNSEEVSRITGVRPFDNKDLTKELHDKVRQRKHQATVDRSEILLDLGTATVAPVTKKRIRFVDPREQTQNILNKRFEQNDSLTFENTFKNDRRVNGKFQFISNYVFSRKVQIKSQTPHALRSCSCMSDHGFCAPNCSCLITQIVTKVEDEDVNIPVSTYQTHRYHPSLIVLSDFLIEDTTHTVKIFECGDSCRCPKQCMNRVVQRGRTVPLQIFETGKYGFGVRSSMKILRGQFIDIYLGEVLTESEVSKREAAAEEDTPSYIMSLDAFITDDKAMFYIDGENFGSVTRFVNHSCEPNCKIIPVVLPKGTKHLYYVAFFAIKDIEAGTELTIDYDPDLLDEEDEDVITDGVVRCQCGSTKCRKRLWAPGKEKRGRRKKYLPSRDDD